VRRHHVLTHARALNDVASDFWRTQLMTFDALDGVTLAAIVDCLVHGRCGATANLANDLEQLWRECLHRVDTNSGARSGEQPSTTGVQEEEEQEDDDDDEGRNSEAATTTMTSCEHEQQRTTPEYWIVLNN